MVCRSHFPDSLSHNFCCCRELDFHIRYRSTRSWNFDRPTAPGIVISTVCVSVCLVARLGHFSEVSSPAVCGLDVASRRVWPWGHQMTVIPAELSLAVSFRPLSVKLSGCSHHIQMLAWTQCRGICYDIFDSALEHKLCQSPRQLK